MKSPLKSMGVFALAWSFAFCGYGAGRASDSLARAEFKPMVARDVDFVFGVNLDKEQAFKVVDAYANAYANLAHLFGVDEKDIREVKKRIAAYREDVFRDVPEDVRKFLDRSGLRNAEFRWAVLSLEGFTLEDGKPRLDGMSLAVAGTIDLKRVISAVQQEEGCDVVFEETRIGGEAAWHVVAKAEKDAREMKEEHVDPYVASLDGRLALAATSRDTLAKQIRLYRRGMGAGDALQGFSAAAGDLMHLHFSGIGDLVRKHVPHANLSGINQIIPNGDRLVLGLKDLDVGIHVSPNGMLRDSLRLGTASENDAESLRTLMKTGVMVLNAQLAQKPKMAELAGLVFGEIQVAGTGREVRVQGGCCMAGVAAGALFPAISSAMLSAKTAAMASNGRKLHQAITIANSEREAAGKGSVWPRTVKAEGEDGDDIAGRAYASATEYFDALFDMKHRGTTEWAPYVVEDIGVEVLGKNAVAGKTISSSGLDWCIAANVVDEMPDVTPVLVSANFNPALLLNRWDGKADGKKRLPIGPKSGAAKSLFNDKAIVVVRKGGRADVIKERNLTYETLYKQQAFDNTNLMPPLKYLTPTGVVAPVGHE